MAYAYGHSFILGSRYDRRNRILYCRRHLRLCGFIFTTDFNLRGHQHHPYRQPESDQRLHGRIFRRPCGIHGRRRVHCLDLFPPNAQNLLFPLAILAGGMAAALVGFLVAIPSFKTRGDYLAIVTLAFGMIVKSILENIDAVGGPRGLLGMEKLTTLPWVFFWTALSVWVIRNLVYSNFGRGVLSIREDEIASDLMSVNTRQVKIIAFVVSSFFAGIAGGLFAHALQFINPRMFDILKSTDILIMVYLGGIASIGGSIIGAVIYTILLEILRPLGIWRMVLMPLMLVLLMIYRPRGIMGMKEIRMFVPLRDFMTEKLWRQKKKEAGDATD